MKGFFSVPTDYFSVGYRCPIEFLSRFTMVYKRFHEIFGAGRPVPTHSFAFIANNPSNKKSRCRSIRHERCFRCACFCFSYSQSDTHSGWRRWRYVWILLIGLGSYPSIYCYLQVTRARWLIDRQNMARKWRHMSKQNSCKKNMWTSRQIWSQAFRGMGMPSY